MHETNTFSTLPTDLDAFRARTFYLGDEVARNMRGTETEIAAFLDACERHGWTPEVPIFACATPSGRVTREAFDTVCDRILDAEGPFDAVLLALHGAMVTVHAEDGEGELLARVREKVGPDAVIAVTLDLHANVSDRMAELTDILIAYRTYPHIDQYGIATQAADMVQRTLDGAIRPRSVAVRGDMLDAVDHGRTTAPGPMTEILASADRLLARPGVLSVSVCAGFPWADIHDAGPSAVIVGDGDDGGYREMAEELMLPAWDSRQRKSIQPIGLDQAMAALARAGGGNGPIVLSDFADNPGGGGYGDATRLLGAMIKAGIEDAAFATIYDPEAAGICAERGPGADLQLRLGGKTDPQFNEPLEVTGRVKAVADGNLTIEGPMVAGTKFQMGPTVALTVGGIDIVITSGRFQVFDRAFFKHVGIDPAAKSVLAVKSAHHFRAAFAPLAREILLVDGGGLTSADLKGFPYENLRRPVFPLDHD